MNYRAEIDGLRAISILPVIFFHAGFEVFEGGYIGVDIFFVISGYLITSIILNDINNKNFSALNFYKRRVKRVIPVLFLISIFCIPFSIILMNPYELSNFFQSLLSVVSFSSNILFWQELNYFDAENQFIPLLHTWSLAVEEQFYILFPIIFIIFYKYKKNFILISIIILFFLSFLLAQWGSANKPIASFFLLPTRGWEILSGSLCAFYLNNNNSRNMYSSDIYGGIGLALIIISVFTFNKLTPVTSTHTVLPIVGTVLIIIFSHKNSLIGNVLGKKHIVGLGLISYSAYLWHFPIFTFFNNAISVSDNLKGTISLTLIVLTIVLSYCTWRFFELPMRYNLSTKKVIIAISIQILIIISFGLYGFNLSLKLKYPENMQNIALQYADTNSYSKKLIRSQYEFKDFDMTNEKEKIFIVGDSFATDIFHSLKKVETESDIQLSMYYIPAKCGTLWTKKDLSKFIQRDSLIECRNHKKLTDKKSVELMKQSDQIWLIAYWKLWQLDFIKETINNINSVSSSKVRIFGNKNFGHSSFEDWVKETNNGKKPYLKKLYKSHIMVNSLMKSQIPSNIFLDLSSIVCRSENLCLNETENGDIISYDGGHLTDEGEVFLGKELLAIDDLLKK